MCNLYSMTKGPQAIRDFARATRSDVGNLPPLPGVFPDYSAPIVRNGTEGRELVLARWGMPSPFAALKGKNRDPGVTNIRNVASPHWKRWLGVESRCVVPFSSFSENEVLTDGPSAGVVCLRLKSTTGFLRRPVDALDFGAKGQGGGNHKRPLWVPHNCAER
jgi:putative SOS response-associated peptidase YedK